MFDIGMPELFIIAVLALIVVGPKDLPKAIRTITAWVRKARSMTRDLQSGVNDMVREAELGDVKDQITGGGDLKKALTESWDPDGSIAKGLSFDVDEDTDNDTNKTKEPLGSNDLDGDSDAPKEVELLNEPLDEDVMPVLGLNDDVKTEEKA